MHKGKASTLYFKSILSRLKRFRGCDVVLLRYIGGVFLVIFMDFLKFFQFFPKKVIFSKNAGLTPPLFLYLFFSNQVQSSINLGLNGIN